MGNQNSEINIEKFRKQDWQAVQKLPDVQVWQNRREPSYRIEQYDVYTQSEAQLRYEKKMFELRRRSPLLVAAYYLQFQPSDEFCSSHSKHLLYLERIPIRLSDVEHIPYPDYLHLFDACLKGFGQLARCAGNFLVDQTMIGINEQGKAKAWLNEDFSKTHPFGGQVSEENMLRSLIDTIEKNIDLQLAPPQTPSVRNFLYKNSDSLNFDSAIWQLGQYIRRFNNGKLPNKLDCIDKAGGIYTIANRQLINQNIQMNESHQKVYKNTGFSDTIAYGNINNQQRLIRQQPKIQTHPVQPIQHIEVQSPRKSQILPQIQFVPIGNRQPIEAISSPTRPNINFVRQSNIVPGRQSINFVAQSPPNLILSPRNSQQINFQPPRQARHVEVPIVQQIKSSVTFAKSPPHSNQAISINHPNIVPISPPSPLILSPPVQQVSPRSFQSFPPQFNQAHITQRIVHQPVYLPPPNQPIPILLPPQVPQASKALKFTVQVVPGKVYPQKSSTIFKQSNASSKPADIKEIKEQPITLLDSHQPIETTSQKVVTEENLKLQQPLQSKPLQLIEAEKQQKVQNHPHITSLQESKQKIQILQPHTRQILQVRPSQQKISIQDLNQKNEKQIDKKGQQRQLLAKVQNNFDAIQKKVMVSLSYEGEQLPPEVNQKAQHTHIKVQQRHPQINHEQVSRQDRMSLWTAGSHQKSIDYQEMQKRLAISFNHQNQAEQAEDQHKQPQNYSNHNQYYNQNHQQYLHNNFQTLQNNVYNDENSGGFYNHNYQYNQYTSYNQNNLVEQTKEVNYNPTRNNVVEYQGITHPQNEVMDDDAIRQTAKFTTETQYYAPLSQQKPYDQRFKSDIYKVNYETDNFNTYNTEKNRYEYEDNYQYALSNNYDYAYHPTDIGTSTVNYSNIEQNSGKSSPDFLKKINQLTAFEPQKPRTDQYLQQRNQSSNSYSDYLRNLTNQNAYSYGNNEINYRNYQSSTPEEEGYASFPHSVDNYTNYTYKIDIDKY